MPGLVHRDHNPRTSQAKLGFRNRRCRNYLVEGRDESRGMSSLAAGGGPLKTAQMTTGGPGCDVAVAPTAPDIVSRAADVPAEALLSLSRTVKERVLVLPSRLLTDGRMDGRMPTTLHATIDHQAMHGCARMITPPIPFGSFDLLSMTHLRCQCSPPRRPGRRQTHGAHSHPTLGAGLPWLYGIRSTPRVKGGGSTATPLASFQVGTVLERGAFAPEEATLAI